MLICCYTMSLGLMLYTGSDVTVHELYHFFDITTFYKSLFVFLNWYLLYCVYCMNNKI